MPRLASACVRAPRPSRPGPARRRRAAPLRQACPDRDVDGAYRELRAARGAGPRLPHGLVGPGGGSDAGRLRRPAAGRALPPALEHARLAGAGGAAPRRRHDRLGRARARRPRPPRGHEPHAVRRAGIDAGHRPLDPREHGEALANRSRRSSRCGCSQGLSFAHCGLMLGMSEDAARMRFGRALHALRRELGRAGRGGPLSARASSSGCRALRIGSERVARRAPGLPPRPGDERGDRHAPADGLRALPVAEAMVTALLSVRREAGDPARSSVRSGGGGATGQPLLEGLHEQRARRRRRARDDRRGVASRPRIATRSSGALSAIAWFAPGGGFPASPAALARVMDLSERSRRDDPDRRGGADGARLLMAAL